MDGRNRTVTFTRDGVVVEEEREAPLSDETRSVKIDEIDWNEFPIDDLTMEVNSVEPIPSDDDETLAGLRFEVAHLTGSTETTPSPREDFWQRVETEIGITYEGTDISLDENASAKTNLVSFVEFLFENDYLHTEDLPIESDWKRYLINTKPIHKKGEEMAEKEPIAGGDAYLETKYSRSAIKEKIIELANEFAE